MNNLEMLDLDDPTTPVLWTGTVDEFTAANDLTEDQLETLTLRGFVILGGGAAPMVLLRFQPAPWHSIETILY